MNTQASNLNLTRIAGLALVALLIAFAIPAAAQAQTSPIDDQYAPGDDVPGGGGGEDPDPDPVPADTGGGGFNEDKGGSGGNGGGGDDSSGTPDDSVAPIVPTETPAAPQVNSTPVPADPSGEPVQNKAQRDLDAIATTAAAERAAAEQASVSPSTDLLSSDSGGGSGMGVFIWVLLAATLAWAIGSGVIRHRQDGQTA